MNRTDCCVTVAGEELALMPERAVYWPRRKTLIVTDLHLGKATTFRASSIPLPTGTTDETLERLRAALARTDARHLLCLGDLLHASQGRSPTVLKRVRQFLDGYAKLDRTLVRGNHDRSAGDPPEDWGFTCVSEPTSEHPFCLRHTPETCSSGYTLAGHVHPGVVLRGRGKQRIQLPCFYLGENVGILPAFGSFTGLANVRPKRGEQIFAITENEVIPLASSSHR